MTISIHDISDLDFRCTECNDRLEVDDIDAFEDIVYIRPCERCTTNE